MKFERRVSVLCACIALVMSACGEESNPSEGAEAVTLYEQSIAHLEPIFTTADQFEESILSLDTSTAKTHGTNIEMHTDAALSYWEKDAPTVQADEAIKAACTKWANYYHTANADYKTAFPYLRKDSLTTDDQLAIRAIFSNIYQKDSVLRAEFMTARTVFFKHHNISNISEPSDQR